MKVQFTSIAKSKLDSVTLEERRAVRTALTKLQGGLSGAEAVGGVQNAYQIRSPGKGPIVLFQVSESGDVATVMGFISSRQRALGNLPARSTGTRKPGTSRRQKSAQSTSSSGRKGSQQRLPEVA
jgi:hypothetical protein